MQQTQCYKNRRTINKNLGLWNVILMIGLILHLEPITIFVFCLGVGDVLDGLDDAGRADAVLLDQDLGRAGARNLGHVQLRQHDIAAGGDHIGHGTAQSTLLKKNRSIIDS